MSALSTDSTAIDDQDRTHGRIRDLLAVVTAAVLEEQPALTSFADHRPERDRPSGTAWRGLETMCHVSALLISMRAPDTSADGAQRLLDSAHVAARAKGLHRRSERDDHGMRATTWATAEGDLLEVIVGVRVAVRAFSAPFLPGSLDPMPTTSPDSPLSPITPPPRLLR